MARRRGMQRAFSAPTNITWAGTQTVAENAALGTQVGGLLSATDPDPIDTVAFSLVDDAGGRFAIHFASVIVTGAIDYETATSHNITIRATDSGGFYYDKVFAVTVTAVTETVPDLPPGSGVIIVDDPGGFDLPPTVVAVDDAIAFSGNKKKGASGKFIFDIGTAAAGQIYTMKYDPDWSLLENGGRTAMVGFGLRQSNDFRISGLKGDAANGLNAYEIYGNNKWNQTAGFSINDGGPTTYGTQAGPNWLQFEVASDGLTYAARTSSDGVAWVDEFTAITPSPFANVTGVTSFGIAVFLDANDAGPFRVDITLWQSQPSITLTTLDSATKFETTLTNGNLTATRTTYSGSAYGGAHSVAYKSTGKYYFEVTIGVNANTSTLGIVKSTGTYQDYTSDMRNCSVVLGTSGGIFSNDVNTGKAASFFATGAVFSVAVDLTARKAWFRKNGANWNSELIGISNPATGAGGVTIGTGSFAPAIGFGNGSLNNSMTANFGATAYVYAVPSGFNNWST